MFFHTPTDILKVIFLKMGDYHIKYFDYYPKTHIFK